MHLYLARVLHDAGCFDEAEDSALRTSALDSASAQAHLVLGGVLRAKNAGDISGAIHAYRRALELDPNDIGTHANLAYSLLFQTDDGYEVLEECKRFADRFQAPFLAPSIAHANANANDRTPDRRLRIGYVSPDFRSHCQALFTTPLLRNHRH
ncbi:TPR domain protein, putative component of TonB system [Candidatus Burkholderia humilis]|nr:TPR domain protein, putative component of TonB system [Candidatus Burkholderia humilis]